MSVSEAPAQVELYSSVASVELSLVASDFRPVATGVGRLSAAVPAGIYQVVARAGPVIDRRLITVAPGETYRDDRLALRFPAPAPVSDTTTTHEYHQAAAEEASGRLSQAAGPPSGLVIVVRDVRGTSGPPLEPTDLAGFALLDSSLSPLGGFTTGWQLRGPEAIATWHGRLPPGGYALRTDLSQFTSTTRAPQARQSFDQSLWLSEHWQTIVFMTTGPAGPQPSAASMHMSQIGAGWSPYDTDVGLALELATWGLREGRSVVTNDLLNLLLNTKFVNPMLGIIGAHSLLLRPQVDWGSIQTVLHNLELMVPGHPDVVALRWQVARRAAAEGDGQLPAAAPGAPGPGATWPPMLLASYRALIEMDAIETSAIADASPAELAAPNLLVQGIWTSWAPIVFAPPPPPPPPEGAAAPVMTSAQVIARLSADPTLLESVPATDPATARVAGYLTALAALEGRRRPERFAELTSQDIALATTLPVSTVERSLSKIGAGLPPPTPPTPPDPPTPPNPPPGIPGALLAVIIAGALLLIAAVGVTAWCAGDASCPLRPATPSPAPTAPPTPRQTATPRPEITPTPQPTPASLDYDTTLPFEPVVFGTGLTRRLFEVSSSEDVPLTFAVSQNPDGVFQAEPTCLWEDVGDGTRRCQIIVTFEPRDVATYLGVLEMHVGDEAEARQIGLSGEATAVLFTVDDEMPTFPDTAINSISEPQILTLNASAPVAFSFSIGQLPDEFDVEPVCAWAAIDPEAHQCTVQVWFSPVSTGPLEGQIWILPPQPAASPTPVVVRGTGFSSVIK